ncbi:uncharacterized protein M421DRAFT_77759, partial [Didymella exigua CBS 183.55]
VNTFKESLILKAFTATSILPVNPDVILNRFCYTTPNNLGLVSSSSTAYSAEN